jgi:fucose permease
VKEPFTHIAIARFSAMIITPIPMEIEISKGSFRLGVLIAAAIVVVV